ncbi:hypothetical protein POJ06DRAFT_259030 [Lipomyces tetrasporus]|uniref:Uncharacterized protein n=1 Tax=Lipomyces tetrasporus TaxID=54092 RepID=A0AAD7VPX0_9ASCO|nr:uncharacterized protein POJ06DRAFT_259030 [Lipomyces tetrasporus]KAJ8098287.1 hypothetical protein POJ06DRAFT_259030 [Lipomyces tetrasporus]
MGSSSSKQAPAQAEPEAESTSPEQTEDSTSLASPEEPAPEKSQPLHKGRQKRVSPPPKAKTKHPPSQGTGRVVKKRKQENELPSAVEPKVEKADGRTEAKIPKRTRTPAKKKSVDSAATVTVKKEEDLAGKMGQTAPMAKSTTSTSATKRLRTKYVKPHKKHKSPTEPATESASTAQLRQKKSRSSVKEELELSSQSTVTPVSAPALPVSAPQLVNARRSQAAESVRVQRNEVAGAPTRPQSVTAVPEPHNSTMEPVGPIPRSPSPIASSAPLAPPQFVPQPTAPPEPQLLPPIPPSMHRAPIPAATAHVSPLISALPTASPIAMSPGKRRRALFENPLPRVPPVREDQPYFVTRTPIPVIAGHSSLNVNGQSILSDPPPPIIINDANIPEGHGYEYNFTCRCGHRFATKGNINRHLKTLRYDEDHVKYVHPDNEVFVHIFPRVRLKKSEYEAIKAKKQAEVEATAALAAMRQDRIEESVTLQQQPGAPEQTPVKKRKYTEFGDVSSLSSKKRKRLA